MPFLASGSTNPTSTSSRLSCCYGVGRRSRGAYFFLVYSIWVVDITADFGGDYFLRLRMWSAGGEDFPALLRLGRLILAIGRRLTGHWSDLADRAIIETEEEEEEERTLSRAWKFSRLCFLRRMVSKMK